jgi:hypothetical protein
MKSKYELEVKEHEQTQIRHEEQAKRSSSELSDLFAMFISTAAATYSSQYSDASSSLLSSGFGSNVSTSSASPSVSNETYGSQYSDASISLSSSEFESNVSTNATSSPLSRETKAKPVAKFYLGAKESVIDIRQYCDIDSRRLSPMLIAGDINIFHKRYTHQCYSEYPKHTGCEEQALRKAISLYNKNVNKFINADCGLEHQPGKGVEK